jgi:DNA-binding transcriptional LysR family regulator
LEKRIGHTLVLRARGARGAELTAAGQRYLDLAERWENLVNAAARLREDRTVSLAVGSVDAINMYLFDPIIGGLAERLPELHLTVETGRGDELSDRVVSDHLDVAFVFYLPAHADLRVTTLAKYSMVAVLHDEPASKVESVADLAGHQEIRLPWGPDYDLWRERNGLPEPAHTVTKAHSLPPVLRLPGSWALVPTFIADDLVDKTGCHVVQLRNGPPPRTVYRVERQAPPCLKQRRTARPRRRPCLPLQLNRHCRGRSGGFGIPGRRRIDDRKTLLASCSCSTRASSRTQVSGGFVAESPPSVQGYDSGRWHRARTPCPETST